MKGRTKGRKLIQSKKIIVDGITFASTLESTMYKLLKESGIKALYEGKTYVLLESLTLINECHERTRKTNPELVDKRKILPLRFTPDFVHENEEFIIEVKGLENESFPLRWKMFKHYISKWDKPPMLFKPMSVADCKKVIDILIEKGYGQKKS